MCIICAPFSNFSTQTNCWNISELFLHTKLSMLKLSEEYFAFTFIIIRNLLTLNNFYDNANTSFYKVLQERDII